MSRADSHMAHDPHEALAPQLPVTVPLVEKRRETPNMVSLFFPHPEPPDPSFSARDNEPGQFIMVWLPGLNEKPFVISYCNEERFGITVLVRGNFTRRLVNSEIGSLVGFRGPYGRGFWDWSDRTDDPRTVLIGGGCGMAPLALLAERAPGATVVQGAPEGDELLFTDRFPDQILHTEDGSVGHAGLPTAWLRSALDQGQVGAVYTCGPEAMMAAVVALCRMNDIPCQAALERYMKCGFGVCGQCDCDGRLVCQDGPVFSERELRDMPSFGRMRRDATGRAKSISKEGHCSVRREPGSRT